MTETTAPAMHDLAAMRDLIESARAIYENAFYDQAPHNPGNANVFSDEAKARHRARLDGAHDRATDTRAPYRLTTAQAEHIEMTARRHATELGTWTGTENMDTIQRRHDDEKRALGI